MAKLTKAARRRAALKGWRNRTRRNAPRRRNAPGRFRTGEMVLVHWNGEWTPAKVMYGGITDSGGKATKRGEGRTWVRIIHGPALGVRPRDIRRNPANPPSGFIPCKDVKIERKNGGYRLLIKR